MKKLIFPLILIWLSSYNLYCQKFAYVDTDYILNKMPEFKQAQDKLDAFSTDWQKEIENKYTEVEQMYITNWYNLEVDGHDVEGSDHNFIVDGHIVSGLGDNDVLNSVYNRQNLKLKTVA